MEELLFWNELTALVASDGRGMAKLTVGRSSHATVQHAFTVDDGLVGELVMPIDVVVVVETTLAIDAGAAVETIVKVADILEVDAV